MDLLSINDDLSQLLQSGNGCEYTDIIDCAIDKIMLSNNIKFNMLHINIRSFHRNKDQLILLLNDLHERRIIVHAIGLCETFLTKNNESLAFVENYRLFHKFRADRTGGGVSILLHDSVMFRKLIDVPLNGSFECCAM